MPCTLCVRGSEGILNQDAVHNVLWLRASLRAVLADGGLLGICLDCHCVLIFCFDLPIHIKIPRAPYFYPAGGWRCEEIKIQLRFPQSLWHHYTAMTPFLRTRVAL